MLKLISISASVAVIAIGWWFTTCLMLTCWTVYAACKLVGYRARGGAW